MTRGNQRDTDRARAEARANASKSSSTLKDRESVAAIMRQKQEAAEAKKKLASSSSSAAAAATAAAPPPPRGGEESARQKAAEQAEKVERLRRAREAAEEALLREQEAARLAADKARQAREERELRPPPHAGRLGTLLVDVLPRGGPPPGLIPSPGRAPLPAAPPGLPSPAASAPPTPSANAKAAPPGLPSPAASAPPTPSANAKAAPPGLPSPAASAPPTPSANAKAAPPGLPSAASAPSADAEAAVEKVRAAAVEMFALRRPLQGLRARLEEERCSLLLDEAEGCVCVRGPRAAAARGRARVELLLAEHRATEEDERKPHACNEARLGLQNRSPATTERCSSDVAEASARGRGDASVRPRLNGTHAPRAEPLGALITARGEEELEKLLTEDDAHAMMEIDIPRECIGKVIGSGGSVIRSIRDASQADVKLRKGSDGAGILVATGAAAQLERVARIVQQIVGGGRSNPDLDELLDGDQDTQEGNEGEGELEEYIMPLPPHDAAKLTENGKLSSVMRYDSKAKKRIEAELDEIGDHVEIEALPGEQPNGQYRIEIELTNKDQAGAIIGEGGRTISSIRKASGAAIHVEQVDGDGSSSRRKIVILGLEEDCMCARKLVEDVLLSNTGKRKESEHVGDSACDRGTLVRFSIPHHLVGRVIGKRGATIRELRERTHTAIEISSDNSGTGVVTISGAPRGVREARGVIEELTQEELPIEVQQTLSQMLKEELCISVPANRVGKVIGTRGAVIQALRQETGASIDLQKSASGRPAIATIRGSIEAMLATKMAIERIIEAPD